MERSEKVAILCDHLKKFGCCYYGTEIAAEGDGVWSIEILGQHPTDMDREDWPLFYLRGFNGTRDDERATDLWGLLDEMCQEAREIVNRS